MLLGKLIYEDNKNDFYIEDNKFCGSQEELERFAVCSNSPWSQVNEKYRIRYNCVDGYTGKDKSEPDWECTYEVVGYDMITSIIYGYGDTPQEALENCVNLFNKLQKEYNKDNESF